MTTCFGSAWPSSGHKLNLQLTTEKTYTLDKAYLEFYMFSLLLIVNLVYDLKMAKHGRNMSPSSNQ